MTIQKIYVENLGTLKLGEGLVCVKSRPGLPVHIGLVCQIAAFEEYEGDDGDEEIEVGLKVSEPRPEWNDMGGLTQPNCGWWFTTRNIKACFVKLGVNIGKDLCIKKDFLYKNVNLKGKKCKVLNTGVEGILLEFEECIGGSSGDGMGRHGHCLLVEEALLTDDKPASAERNTNKVPNDGLIEVLLKKEQEK